MTDLLDSPTTAPYFAPETYRSTPSEPTLEPRTKMKPSEALRLGRLQRPKHVKGKFFDGDDAACAVGVMALGFGGEAGSYHEVLRRNGVTQDEISTMYLLYDGALRFGFAGEFADGVVIEYLEDKGL